MPVYILDTNILLHNPDSLFSFGEADIIIPFTVIEELDNRKKGLDEVGKNARHVTRQLDSLREKGNLSNGVKLPNGGTLKIELNNTDAKGIPLTDIKKYDNKILVVAYNINKKYSDVTFYTNDLNLRVKADVLGIKTKEYYNDKVNHKKLYNETKIIEMYSYEINKFYMDGELEWSSPDLYPNEFFILKSIDKQTHSGVCRYLDGKIYKLNHENDKFFDLYPKNKEQKFATELLLDNNVKIIALIGPAGTGKTILALAAGLEQVVNNNIYSKLLLTRPMASLGQDIGFLKGDKDEKFRPWMSPLYDNMEFLFRNNSKKQANQIIEHLKDMGQLDMEPLTYIRGRSIPNQFIICDEAQNMSRHLIKTLLTRIGENTKIVLTGDLDQIDTPYLDASTSGLSYIIKKLKSENLFGYVNFVKGERSKTAELCSRLL